jgi:hypothetical protein
MRWKSAQYAAADRLPCLVALNLLLATSLELASLNTQVITVLNSSQVAYMLFPWFIDSSIHAQALPQHLERA